MAGAVALGLIYKTAFVNTIRLFSLEPFIISDFFLIFTSTTRDQKTSKKLSSRDSSAGIWTSLHNSSRQCSLTFSHRPPYCSAMPGTQLQNLGRALVRAAAAVALGHRVTSSSCLTTWNFPPRGPELDSSLSDPSSGKFPIPLMALPSAYLWELKRAAFQHEKSTVETPQRSLQVIHYYLFTWLNLYGFLEYTSTNIFLLTFSQHSITLNHSLSQWKSYAYHRNKNFKSFHSYNKPAKEGVISAFYKRLII